MSVHSFLKRNIGIGVEGFGSFYDEDKCKYVSDRQIPALDWLTRSWEGEDDILHIMLLKIEHMFWNLKKHGMQADFYIDSYNFMEENRKDLPESDLAGLLKRFLKSVIRLMV